MAKFRLHAKLLAISGRKYGKNLSLSILLQEETNREIVLIVENFPKREIRMLRNKGKVGC